MAGILDSALLVGKESTYGTAVALSRAYEAKADSWKRSQEFLGSAGFRGGMHTQLSTRSVPVNMGGEGTLELDVAMTGMGLIFQSMLGAVTGPTVVSGTAYKSTFTSTAAGSADSWTVQMQRVGAGGTVLSFTHLGSMMTGWKFSQEVDGLLGVEMNFDCMDISTVTAAGTPTYPTSTLPFSWVQAAATWNAVAVDLTEWSLEADLGMNTDRRFLRGSALKKKPVRAAVPEFSGEAKMEFESLTHYDAFVAGTIAPLVVTWTGPIISGAVPFELKVTLAAVQFQGDSPESSLDGMPTQTLPYKVLWNGTDPAVKIEYTSSDVAL